MKIKLHFLLAYMKCMAREPCFETPSLLVSSYTFHMMTAFSECREYFSHHRNCLVGNVGEKSHSWLLHPIS